ncbi:DUF3307 domain-containing protein [Roseisalinus antarcticus]|uniref:DUF3307 domain-containing protein n=1 Tax=Roseisalinus antarcticus TaxID=254357 RepID=A0A1Y5T1V6_9RHOB|nr:DUF3307 domain-containing protein [Roseisalinus antarcticus]SLN54015.1 hypothetical protein ROA7023_02400 [Roseisalinus antarcticus]
MAETFVALLFAHVLADFVLQTDAMVRRKAEPLILLAHAAVVLVTALAVLGTLTAWPVYALAAAHLAIDTVKLQVGDRLGPYLLDQAAHVASLAAVALVAPALWAASVWAGAAPDALAAALPAILLHLAGFIVAVRAGGFTVGKLLEPMTAHWTRARILGGGFPQAGLLIGQLERGLTFALVLAGQPTAVAFLIAAKSVLRFNATREDRRIAEYVIIGTLASVGWALFAAYATLWLNAQL